MKSMLLNGLYSDISIVLSGGKPAIKAHRCVLYMRSKPLRDLIDDNLAKGVSSQLDLSGQVKDDEASHHAFTAMINFLYSGEIVFPKCPFEVIQILKVCSAVQRRRLGRDLRGRHSQETGHPEHREDTGQLRERSQGGRGNELPSEDFLPQNFEAISQNFPDIEEQLAACPGLTKKLFLHISGKKKTFKRKVTFVDFDINADSHDL